jgi:hypothetical protein
MIRGLDRSQTETKEGLTQNALRFRLGGTLDPRAKKRAQRQGKLSDAATDSAGEPRIDSFTLPSQDESNFLEDAVQDEKRVHALPQGLG